MNSVALALLLLAPPAPATPKNTELARIVFRAHDPERLRAVANGFVRPTRQDLFKYSRLETIPGAVLEAIRDHLKARRFSEDWDKLTWAGRTEKFDLAVSSPTRGLVDLGSVDIVVGFLLPTADVHSSSILALERVMHLARQSLGAYTRMNVARHAHTCLPFSANCIVRSAIFRWIVVSDALATIEMHSSLAQTEVFTLARRSGRRVDKIPSLRDGDPILVEWADDFPRPRRIEFIRGVGLFDSMFSEIKQSPSDEIYGNFPWNFDDEGLTRYFDHFERLMARKDNSPDVAEYARAGLAAMKRVSACTLALAQ